MECLVHVPCEHLWQANRNMQSLHAYTRASEFGLPEPVVFETESPSTHVLWPVLLLGLTH